MPWEMCISVWEISHMRSNIMAERLINGWPPWERDTIVSEMLLTNSVWTTWPSKIIRMLSKLGSSSCRTLNLTNSFRSYLDQALKIFASRTYHRNELARSTYKQGQLHAAIGKHDAADQAFQSAYKLRSMIVPEDKRPMEELCEKDYDDMVIYWSR